MTETENQIKEAQEFIHNNEAEKAKARQRQIQQQIYITKLDPEDEIC